MFLVDEVLKLTFSLVKLNLMIYLLGELIPNLYISFNYITNRANFKSLHVKWRNGK